MDELGDNATSSMVGSLAALEADPAIRARVDRYQGEVA